MAIDVDDFNIARYLPLATLNVNSFGFWYAVGCVGVYASIYVQGRGNVMMRNGTVIKDGKPVAQPFKFSAEDAASAARSALNGTRTSDTG